MNITEKINDILNIIREIQKEEPGIAGILYEGLGISIDLLKEIAANGDRTSIDLSKQLEMITNVLGISVEDIVKNSIQQHLSIEQMVEYTKEPDEETLKFITSDLDDYEKFLAENKSKDNLDFLSKQI